MNTVDTESFFKEALKGMIERGLVDGKMFKASHILPLVRNAVLQGELKFSRVYFSDHVTHISNKLMLPSDAFECSWASADTIRKYYPRHEKHNEEIVYVLNRSWWLNDRGMPKHPKDSTIT